MKTRILGLAVGAALAAGSVFAAYEKPTREQLQAAAENPALVVTLVKDANPDQAAEVGKDVIIQIIRLDLKPEERNQRFADLIRYLFTAMPQDAWMPLAMSLGRFVAASPAASASPDIVSAIEQAIIQFYNVDFGNAFANAYLLAMQTVAGAPGGGKTVPPQPPPPPVALPLRPPVATGYEAQQLP